MRAMPIARGARLYPPRWADSTPSCS
jgi:hypothetical protein